ncbi:MAG TPA: choice-of-anchor tandem repeat GloVer-containing protein [Candidatus Cybelea sp.]
MTERRVLEAVAAAILAIALAACSLAAPFSTTPFAASSRTLPEQNLTAHYKLLYQFGQNGKFEDGRTPLADLVAIGDTLYGTTAYGGATTGACSVGCGTLFRVSPAGSEVVLHRFKGGASDGAIPIAGLLVIAGALYGTTSGGGAARACSGGCGTVFTSSAQGKARILHRFRGGSDGAQPAAALISDNGVLYGTTTYGGSSTPCPMGCGTVFSLSPSGANEKVIYEFKGGADGAQPAGRLIALGGDLYGTTQYGGRRTAFCATGCGTVFRLAPDGSAETVLYRFAYGPRNADGAYPAAGLAAVAGVLYGTTASGGLGSGTAFSLHPATKVERTLHVFDPSTNDGTHPDARLIDLGGALYGTTRDGGTRAEGTIFQISKAGAERVLYSFTAKPDGAKPEAQLLSLAGTLYGTTSRGGATSGGAVFGLTP